MNTYFDEAQTWFGLLTCGSAYDANIQSLAPESVKPTLRLCTFQASFLEALRIVVALGLIASYRFSAL